MQSTLRVERTFGFATGCSFLRTSNQFYRSQSGLFGVTEDDVSLLKVLEVEMGVDAPSALFFSFGSVNVVKARACQSHAMSSGVLALGRALKDER